MTNLHEKDDIRNANSVRAEQDKRDQAGGVKPAVPSETQPKGDPAKGGAKPGQESQNDRP